LPKLELLLQFTLAAFVLEKALESIRIKMVDSLSLKKLLNWYVGRYSLDIRRVRMLYSRRRCRLVGWWLVQRGYFCHCLRGRRRISRKAGAAARLLIGDDGGLILANDRATAA
jgi:hypothetical protein